MSPEQKYRQGDVHPATGMVFWSRQASCAGGMRWVTPEKFEQKRASIAIAKGRAAYREGERARRNTEEERAKRNKYAKRWRSTPAYRTKAAQAARDRRAQNPLACLADRMRARIGEAIRERGYGKRSQTNALLGCGWDEFRRHIESKFLDGMTWKNRDQWHVDHVIALAAASSEEELARLFHYTNTQPLWAVDNQRKGAR